MYTVIDEWKVGKYIALKLNQAPPFKPYRKYCIDGIVYDAVPVYDLPKCIAIEAEGSFIGKNIEFV